MTALIIGRFQPPHPGHMKLIRAAFDDGHHVLIAIVKGKNPKYNYDDNPLSYYAQIPLIWAMVEKNELEKITFIEVESADIVKLREERIDINYLYCGSDRKDVYQKMIEDYDLPIKVMPIVRDIDNTTNGSDIRQMVREHQWSELDEKFPKYLDWVLKLYTYRKPIQKEERVCSFKEDIKLKKYTLLADRNYVVASTYTNPKDRFMGIVILEERKFIMVPKTHLLKITKFEM